ncbi:hypothetical protein [Chryseobacterium sp. KCF3-3]|uniref:hypothetical protein n=1 Tax=Chryseobacterium sp. KCF3-3 TaxID=3231511 RepID=UPI0038B2F442
MKANAEHYKAIAFVDRYKEANKNTVHRVRQYDPKLRMWTLEAIITDENALKFSEENRKNKRRQREKEKREKNKTVKKFVIPAKPVVETTKQSMPTKPRSQMRLNVVRLHKEGKKFKEIGDMYNVSENSARVAYHKEIHGK